MAFIIVIELLPNTTPVNVGDVLLELSEHVVLHNEVYRQN